MLSEDSGCVTYVGIKKKKEALISIRWEQPLCKAAFVVVVVVPSYKIELSLILSRSPKDY